MVALSSSRAHPASHTAPTFAERLRHHRERCGLTQEELAEAAGLTARAIGALKRGERRSPYPHTIRALAAALALAPGDLQHLLIAARRGEAPANPAALITSPGFPVHATPLIGREGDVAAADALLGQPEVRLLTLSGPGGVGKTRLALHLAAGASARFDGVVVAWLASLTVASQVPRAIAQALGLPDMGHRSAIDSIVTAIRDQPVLLVLDNFEHLDWAATRVGEILAACPRVKLLATSRATLGSRSERHYPVAPLAVPESGIVDCDEMLAYPAIRLFIERARALDPAFTLGPEETAAVAEICRRLDGMPLAIELAAARTRVLAPRAMLPRLANHLDLLTGGPRDLPARQRTVRSTIAWSHQLLSGDEQAALRRLAVFTGGFTIAGAEAVLAGLAPAPGAANGGAILDQIDSLVGQNLLIRMPGGDDGFRFRMQESVREFGLEHLAASDEAAMIRDRHATWCLSLAQQGFQELLGADQALWQERLETEHANLRAAIAWLRGQGDLAAALQLGAFLARFWWYQGHYGQGQKELDALLSLPGADSVAPWWAAAMTGLGMLVHKQGDYRRAVEVHEAALAAWRAMGDPRGLLEGSWAFGYTQMSIEPAAAIARFRESLALAEMLGETWYIGASHWGWGASARYLGRTEESVRHLDICLDTIQLIDNPLGLAATWLSLGQVERDLGNGATATGLLRDALVSFEQQRLPWGIITCLEALATVARAACAPARAARLLGAADALRETIGQTRPPVDLPEYTRSLAGLREALGEPRFTTLWAEGRSLRLPAAVAYALSGDDAGPGQPELRS